MHRQRRRGISLSGISPRPNSCGASCFRTRKRRLGIRGGQKNTPSTLNFQCFPSTVLSDCEQYIRREIITHAQLRHPNVIPFLGVSREDDDIEAAPAIILPFLENGSANFYL